MGPDLLVGVFKKFLIQNGAFSYILYYIFQSFEVPVNNSLTFSISNGNMELNGGGAKTRLQEVIYTLGNNLSIKNFRKEALLDLTVFERINPELQI